MKIATDCTENDKELNSHNMTKYGTSTADYTMSYDVTVQGSSVTQYNILHLPPQAHRAQLKLISSISLLTRFRGRVERRGW